MANARQIALRTRLRHHYWLTDCRPFTVTTVDKLRRKMALIDPQDTMGDEQVAELLTPDHGFSPAGEGAWRIDDLDEARGVAVGSIDAQRERMAQLGRASAAKRATGRDMAGPQGTARVAEPITGDLPADF